MRQQTAEVSSHLVERGLCLWMRTIDVDSLGMTITSEHIYNKTCEKCDRPALTYDRDNLAMCPRHATAIVRAEPVKGEIPVTARLPTDR